MSRKWLTAAAGVMLACAALSVALFTSYAIFFQEKQADIDAQYHSFRAVPRVYFAGATPQDAVPDAQGWIAVDYENAASPNSLANLRVDVAFEGKGEALLRVAVLELWEDAEGNVLRMPYTAFATPFVDGRRHSSYYYYRDFSAPSATDSQKLASFVLRGGPLTLPVVTGLEPGFTWPPQPQGTTLKIRVAVSAVQKNRFSQLWGLSESRLLELAN